MKLTVEQLKKVGIRQVEIADWCDVSDPAVYKWEEMNIIPPMYHKKIKKEVLRRFKLMTTLVEKVF